MLIIYDNHNIIILSCHAITPRWKCYWRVLHLKYRFFNAGSTLLIGNESRSVELRYRCVVELISKRQATQLHPQYKKHHKTCDNINRECITCTVIWSHSSMMRLVAMFNLITDVVYPATNCTNAMDFTTINTLRPPYADLDTGRLTLMRSAISLQPSKPWRADNMVPLVDDNERGHFLMFPRLQIKSLKDRLQNGR